MAFLDQKDKSILEHLFQDARYTTKELAKFIGITQPAVYTRLKRLENEKFILRYDAIINYQLIPLIKKSYLCNLNEEQIRKVKEDKECVVLISNIGQYKHHLFCWFQSKTQQKRFERLLPKKREEFILEKVYTKNSSLFDMPLKQGKINYKEKELRLTKEDIKFLKAYCEGGVRKTLKELSDKTGLSIDVVYYRKKRLISNGYFTYFVAQPGFGALHLDFSYIYIITKKKTFPDISRTALFAELDRGILLGFFSKDINDFNNTIDEIYEYYRDDCYSPHLVTNKEYLILNRYPFEFLLSRKTIN